ncbi:MAG: HAMP domain-containing protein, partial [Verrucomicrobiaceae bacterium]
MAKGVLGLQGKFIVALLVAAALPFLVGLAVFETVGYRHLLEERGRYHQMEALTLVRALDQAADAVGGQIQTWLSAQPALVGFAITKNKETAGMAAEDIRRETLRLDELWASLPSEDPMLRSVLENPGSASLARFRSLHPAVAEILATDAHGRLISATGKSSDLDQADEDWWQKGAAMGKGGIWTDVLRFDASSDVFSQDVVLPLYDGETLAGVVKVSVDVTSLFAQLGFDGEAAGERWEIVLPDGWVLASSRSDFQPRTDQFPTETVSLMTKQGRGWTVTGYHHGEDRMTGFVALAPEGGNPNAYVLFSSRRDDVVAPLQKDFLWLGIAGASLLLLCALTGFYLIHSGILAPLAALGNAARSISATARLHHPVHGDESRIALQREQAEDDLRKIEAIRTGDEVEALAGDLAVMTSRVLRYQRELETEVAAKTAVIREDLEMAREFQNALMPSHYPEVPSSSTETRLRLKFSHFYQPASTVGGDFFDLIELDNGRAGILIADVMGH